MGDYILAAFALRLLMVAVGCFFLGIAVAYGIPWLWHHLSVVWQ